jgi:RHS repeat-associated protein
VGRRRDEQSFGALLYGDQLNPIAQLDTAGNVTASFVYGSRANVPDYMVKAGTAYRILADHLGSPRLVVDVGTGVVAERIDYDAHGRIIADTEPGFQPFAFAGGVYDGDAALVRFGWRDYDPGTGRWSIKDPILFAGGSSNLYAYALEDPVNLIDPDGLQAIWDIPDWISAGLSLRDLACNPSWGNAGWFGLDLLGAALPLVPAAGTVRRAADFVVTPRGQAIHIPRGATGPTPTRAPGVQYVGGSGGRGLDSRVTGIRIMEGNANQGPRVIYMNSRGQTVDPTTGRTVPNADPRGHHYLDPW